MSASDRDFKRYDKPSKAKGGKFFEKGRQIDIYALEEVRALLGERPRRNDLLVEHLHLIQDHFGHLSHRHLVALAEDMRLALAEVFEVATFYHHFDVVPDEETAPPALTVRVCDSLTCSLYGAQQLLGDLKEAVGDRVRVIPAPCVGRCEQAPVVAVGKRFIAKASVDSAKEHIENGAVEPAVPDFPDHQAYRDKGGYQLLDACLAGKYSPQDIISILNDSGLRGLGGAGFPTGRKWEFVRREPGPRLMAVNADEGEPGTFKDRYYIETDPHRFLEGTLIGAWAVQATDVYIYLRDEYPELHLVLQREINALISAGLDFTQLHLRRGAGAYICGEESAMLESIEGKRGLPRHKPPFPSQVGLFGRPTLINNVETLYWVRDIIEKGPESFSKHGRNGGTGLRTFSVSGRVKESGVKLAPAGISVQELIDEYCGGMEEGHSFKAYLPGGASGGMLPASMADIPLDFGTLEEHGCLIGSAAVIVLSDHDQVREAALNLMSFFEHESCGQCTPCRVGTEKAARLMQEESWNQPLLEDLCTVMAESSICGLGQAAVNPVRMTIAHFPEEVT
tara:strand:- start:395 stop:2092 length:1698 start_codon:yes stop_codon:yes gene_type:complete